MPTPPPRFLTPHWFQILLAIGSGTQHGLAIMREVAERTDGDMVLWPGMLYRALRDLAKVGFIAETEAPPAVETGGGRPRYYQLTALGRRAVAEEARRLTRYLRAARAKGLYPREASR